MQEVRSRLELEFECLLSRREYALAMVISEAVQGLDAEISGDAGLAGAGEAPQERPPGL